MSKKKEKRQLENTAPSLEIINKELLQKDYDLLDRELSMELKKVQLSEKRLSLQEKQQEVEQMENRRLLNDERKTAIEMIEVITDAMLGHVIDAERSILGSEPHYVPVFDEIERGLLKKKVFDLLKQF
jgi:ribosome-binding ATPase YchF (GTP1/OBG family)